MSWEGREGGREGGRKGRRGQTTDQHKKQSIQRGMEGGREGRRAGQGTYLLEELCVHADRLLKFQQVPMPHRRGQGEVGKEGATEGGLVKGSPFRDVT